jgi:hypothetical protein
VKEAFEAAFRKAQGTPGVKLDDWMLANPDDFYKICAKLIPNEIKGQMDHKVTAPELAVIASALGVAGEEIDLLLRGLKCFGSLRAKP